ncbi:MAG: hypothetical protein L0332_04625 [Chloroflexi bacterium]|nr:hypothetical protein [Chloroflexota bacterium]MCI0577334.1 hypothetical protein [Chloroflexota bacterium]MCI0648134.1 hypothetical protein [Chloroflexota bacterium]MCI0725992.1 hypothetical protein [Chloroflexota bacterium]
MTVDSAALVRGAAQTKAHKEAITNKTVACRFIWVFMVLSSGIKEVASKDATGGI